MDRVGTPREVFEAIQHAKAESTTFCTNFYPSPQKLEAWIAQADLYVEHCDASVFFLRRDCDFWHLFFCARTWDALRIGLNSLRELQTERVVTEIVGGGESVEPLLPILENAGLFRYKQLIRMARIAQDANPPPCNAEAVRCVALADSRDAAAVLALIASGFDRYAKNIPVHREIEEAINARQIIVVRQHSDLDGLLFFETHGVTSTLRFWTVADRVRSTGAGSALMRYYLDSHNHIRRFILWVNSDNEKTIKIYQHYHYARDGVVDCVLANEWIPR